MNSRSSQRQSKSIPDGEPILGPSGDHQTSAAPSANERGLNSALSRHAPPQPAELREARTGMINLKELRAAQEDPAIGLLDSLQAVREKQSPPGRTPSAQDHAPGVITSADSSTLIGLFSSRTSIFIALALAAVFIVWGVMSVLDRASRPIVPNASTDRPTVNSSETTEAAAGRSGSPGSGGGAAAPNLSRPSFPRLHPGNPGPRAGLNNENAARPEENHAAPPESAVDLDAEKEKQRQREEEERQRDAGVAAEPEAAQGQDQSSGQATAPDTGDSGENRSPQSVPQDTAPSDPGNSGNSGEEPIITY